MRWVAAAIVVAAAALWWMGRSDEGAARQSRAASELSTKYESHAERSVDRKGPGETGTQPRAEQEPAPPPTTTDESSASYVVLRCRDERGEPQAGLTVEWGYPNQVLFDPIASVKKTDARGRATITWPGAAGSSILIHVCDEERHGYEARVTAKTRATPDGAPLDLVIPHPAERLVRVVDTDGQPVPGATVKVDPVIVNEGMVNAWHDGWELPTNALGECIVTAGRSVPYRLTANAEGFAEKYIWEWHPPEDDRPTVLELSTSCSVTGAISALESGARALFDGPTHEEAKTDEEGRFRLDGLVPGEYRIVVIDKEKRVRAVREVTVRGDMEIDPITAQPVVERRLEILDVNRNRAKNAFVRTEPGGRVFARDSTGQVRFESATIPGIWVIVSAAKCGSLWIPVNELDSPVVLPKECTLRVFVELGESRSTEFLPFELGPPGRPPRTELVICDDEREVRVFDGLPPGPLDIEFLGQKRRVELHPDKPVDVHFRVGK